MINPSGIDRFLGAGAAAGFGSAGMTGVGVTDCLMISV
jgi:hypothetical protein